MLGNLSHHLVVHVMGARFTYPRKQLSVSLGF
jgi:hypothetical protein